MQSENIRRLTTDDVPALVPLFDAYRQFYRQAADRLSATAFLYDRIMHNEAFVYGYFEGDQLAGFTLLYPMFSSVRMKPFYLLNDLFVLPEYRNAHIGRALLDYCKSIAKNENLAGIMLETEKSNQVGNHLYPGAGFQFNADSNFYFWENT